MNEVSGVSGTRPTWIERLLMSKTPEEREQLLDYMLENMVPKEHFVPELVHFAETVEDALRLRQEDGKLVGLSTGYKNVDAMVRGLRESQIMVVFGETGHRKSMFVQNVAANVAVAGTPVLFIGLEMDNAENTERWLSMGFNDLPIVYPPSTDVSYKDIDGLVAKAVEMGVGLVVIDHLHMFTLEGDNDASAITKICVEFKRVTRKHGIPMILVSHISAHAEGEVPTLSSLKGSTSIKQIADKAIAVFSPGVADDLPDDEIRLFLKKSRVRAEHKYASLRILPNARLVEPTLDAVFSTRPSRPLPPQPGRAGNAGAPQVLNGL